MDPLIVFTPSGKRGRFPVGTPVLTAARQLGVDIDSVCGGRGICGRCQVDPGRGQFPKHGIEVAPDAAGPATDTEARYDRVRGLKPGRRLSCQAVLTSDLVVDVPEESQMHRQVVRKDADTRPIALDPATRLHAVEVAQPDMHHPSGDAERLRDALAAQWGLTVRLDPALLPSLQRVLRDGAWTVTAAVQDGTVTQLFPGVVTDAYGLAIDLGSTTVAAHLCHLVTGETVASAGLMNPQIRFGEDLMSRVSYAMMNPGGTAEMTAAVREALDRLAGEVCEAAGIERGAIVEAVLVGNPVMHHLLLGIDPTELGQAPFALAIADALTLPARDYGLNVAPGATLHILPCIAGHVGADAAAVVLAESPETSDDLVLIVDVGTNAEIVLGNRAQVLACSSPTGPAFEGAQISAGQRAAPGAIERVRIEEGRVRLKVIGSELWSDEEGFPEPTGICGSGIIEAVAEMRRAGLMDQTGVIGSAEATGCAAIVPEGRTHALTLWEAERPIRVTQTDVRAIQLAKSALHAGARLLMDRMGAEQVDRVVLAGAFGAHISPLHALILGMIPDCDPARVTSAGNAAGTGARMALLNKDFRAGIAETVRRVEKVETAVEPRFQEHFVAANHVPHATEAYALLSASVLLPTAKFGSERQRRVRASR